MSYDDRFIYKLFLGRCVVCNRMATELNHIIPRSRGREYKEDWKNVVPMCHDHHEEYHDGGVTDEKVQLLQQKRIERLTAMNKEDYI